MKWLVRTFGAAFVRKLGYVVAVALFSAVCQGIFTLRAAYAIGTCV